MSDDSGSSIRTGIGCGSVMAMIISWSVNHSILWLFLHGMCGWFYVLWWIFYGLKPWES